MESEITAIVLCVLALVSMTLVPELMLRHYRASDRRKYPDVDAIPSEVRRKQLRNQKLYIWSYRFGGVVMLGVAAFICRTDILG